LFDLLTKRQSATPAASARQEATHPMPEIRATKPVVRVELKPREIPEPPPQRTEPTWSEPPGVRLPTNLIYIASALMLTLLVFAWIAGSKIGEWRQAKVDEPHMQRPAPAISEIRPDSPDLGQPPIGSKAGTGSVQAPQTTAGDPREKGLNYLYLAVVSQAEAQGSGKFLREHGVAAYATPMVDTKGSGANNAAPLYRLFVLPGIPGGELKKTEAQNLQTRVLELGADWAKQQRGNSNFAGCRFEKYQ
jgi:hypothetical protein